MHQRSKISLAAVLALGSLAGLVHAQEAAQPQQIERVEITGSRIRQIDIETSQPVFKMSQEEIQKSGLVTVGDILNSMSSAGSPAFSKGSVLTSNREQGGQYINLRNLGAQRLLVLVNGKRWSSTVAGYTDLSTVPSAMIDRIEVLKDGASSTYGSDAIAGVVNIILKKSMEGGTFSAYVGENDKGDGRTEDYSLSYGAGNDKASLMFGFSYSKQEPVWAKDRTITATSFGPAHMNAGYGAAPWGRICAVSSTGGCGGLLGNTNGQMINHTGGPLGDGVGQASNVIGNYHPYAGADADTFNSSSQMMFQSPTELKTLFTKGSIEVTPDVRFNSTAMYAKRDSERQIAGYPVTSTTQLKYPVYIDANSYFNPVPGTQLYFARRTIEVPRVTANANRTLHLDANLEGDVTIAGMPWTWSTGVNYSNVSGTTLSTGNLNLLNLKKALGPSFKNAQGVVQCGTAAAPIPLSECTPFDIIGGPSASTPQALAYVMSTGQGTYGSTVKSFTADASGEIFKLPAGNVGVAFGVERREVNGFDRPGQFEQSGYSTDLAANTTQGQYTVKEAYAELNIPILKGMPLAEALSLNLASRYSDYSSFGDTTNSKASFVWKPIKDLLTRGTYAQGFRAPTLGDTFGGGSQSYDSYLDPCDSSFGAVVGNATAKAQCAAAGVSTTFRQKNQAGNNVPSGGAQTPYPFNSGVGNGSLTPEKATTRTLGLVYSPSYLAGLTASLDWYEVKVTNRIAGVSAAYVLNQCYVEGVQSFCNSIKRDSTGQITYLERGNQNLGELKTSGFDLGLNYRFPATRFGQFSFRSETSYVDSFKIKSTPTANWANYTGEWSYNRIKSNMAVDWRLGAWSATWSARYFSGIRDRCWNNGQAAGATAVECSNPTGSTATVGTGLGYNQLGSLVYHDVSVGFKTPWKGQILVGANNVFDKQPRVTYLASSTYGGTSSASSVDPDLPIDRFMWVRYNQSF